MLAIERLSALAHAVAVESHPNTEAKARERAGGNLPLYNQLVAHGIACISPGFRFYQHRFSGEFHTTVRAFRAATLCCPVQVQTLHPTAASVEELKHFSFLNNDTTITGFLHELPHYLAVADWCSCRIRRGKSAVVVKTRTGSSKLVSSCKEDFADSTKLSLSGTCL